MPNTGAPLRISPIREPQIGIPEIRLGEVCIGEYGPTQRRARLARAVPSQVGREDYVRVRLFSRDGELWADPLPGGSSAISNLVLADGLVKIEAARDRIAEGDPVEVAGF